MRNELADLRMHFATAMRRGDSLNKGLV
jgi:hypothetical protein